MFFLQNNVFERKVVTFSNFCCLFCCCQSGPLVIYLQLPVSGYVPGQIINLILDVDNQSDEEMEHFTVKLMKHIIYYTHKDSPHSCFEEFSLVSETIPGCSVSESKTLRANLEIPPIPPTDRRASSICNIRYFLRVKGPTGGCRNDVIIDLPITIGSIPISEETMAMNVSTTTQPRAQVFTEQPTAPLLPGSDNDPSPPYPAGEPGPSAPSAPYPGDGESNSDYGKYPKLNLKFQLRRAMRMRSVEARMVDLGQSMQSFEVKPLILVNSVLIKFHFQ